jgi:hypothetical protein
MTKRLSLAALAWIVAAQPALAGDGKVELTFRLAPGDGGGCAVEAAANNGTNARIRDLKARIVPLDEKGKPLTAPVAVAYANIFPSRANLFIPVVAAECEAIKAFRLDGVDECSGYDGTWCENDVMVSAKKPKMKK